jgi:hypothetical protein
MVGDILYTNPETGKTQKLFDMLLPVFIVCCRNDNVVEGYKGCAVYITVQADNEEKAMLTALANPEFTKHIRMKDFTMKYLSAYKPSGNYVIGKVSYYEGDKRL